MTAPWVALLLLLLCRASWAGLYDLPAEPEKSPARRAPRGTRLIATGGLLQIEGAGGGGLVPWALLAGYGTREGFGAAAAYAHAGFNDYRLNAVSAALTWGDRLEFSAAQQEFQLVGAVLPGNTIRQRIFGVKARLFGDAVFDQDSLLPQVSAGVQHKRNLDFDFIPRALGARRAEGTDVYLTASKLFLGALGGRNLLLNAGARASEANQLGLLGFGARRSSYRLLGEASAAVLLDDRTAVGAEARQKPDNLSAAPEDYWGDVFVAYFPNKTLGFALAYARLGRVAGKRQSGPYLSAQVSY